MIASSSPVFSISMGLLFFAGAVAWFRYAVPHQVRTRDLAIRMRIRKGPRLRGDEPLLAFSRWGGAAFLVVCGVLVIAVGLGHL